MEFRPLIDYSSQKRPDHKKDWADVALKVWVIALFVGVAVLFVAGLEMRGVI